MILLDTDHVSVLKMPGGDRRNRLVGRLTLLHPETVSIPVIVTEETMRGWLAAVSKGRDARRQVGAFDRTVLGGTVSLVPGATGPGTVLFFRIVWQSIPSL